MTSSPVAVASSSVSSSDSSYASVERTLIAKDTTVLMHTVSHRLVEDHEVEDGGSYEVLYVSSDREQNESGDRQVEGIGNDQGAESEEKEAS